MNDTIQQAIELTKQVLTEANRGGRRVYVL